MQAAANAYQNVSFCSLKSDMKVQPQILDFSTLDVLTLL